MRRSVRYNLAQGFAGTVQDIGGAVTNAAVGLLVQSLDYTLGFFSLAAIGANGLALIFFFMRETMPSESHPAPPAVMDRSLTA
jgi:sugar phosphate permease